MIKKERRKELNLTSQAPISQDGGRPARSANIDLNNCYYSHLVLFLLLLDEAQEISVQKTRQSYVL